MNANKKMRLRPIVRSVMENKVNSLIDDDIFMDNETRDRVWDSLSQSDLSDDPEVEECIMNGNDGAVVTEVVEAFIDTLTNAFMKRFENK